MLRSFTKEELLLIQFKRKEAGITIEQLANEILMSKSNMSRIENGKIMVSEENEILLAKRFSIKFDVSKEVYLGMCKKLEDISEQLIFYKLFNDYSREKLEETNENISESIAYPIYILMRLYVYTAKNIEHLFSEKYILIIEDLIELYESKYQKIFYIAKMNFCYFNKNYEEAIKICQYIEDKYQFDEILDSFLYHMKAIIYGCLGEKEIVLTTLNKAILFSAKTNNIVRKIALYITKSNYIRLLENYKLALEQDFQTLKYTKVHNVHIYDYILLRNIAWTYYLMDDYENAIKRYKIAEELDIDDDLCFITAYCYFKLAMDCESPSQKLDLRIKCKEYLNKGRKSKNSGIAFPYLIDWLELMLNKKYSVKAEQKLLYCLKKHETTMHVDSRNNIYKFLIEHYEYHQDSKNADYYRKKLQNG